MLTVAVTVSSLLRGQDKSRPFSPFIPAHSLQPLDTEAAAKAEIRAQILHTPRSAAARQAPSQAAAPAPPAGQNAAPAAGTGHESTVDKPAVDDLLSVINKF